MSDDRILDAAAVEFAANRFAGASMQTIADGASTTKATIYANLGDKDRLYQAVIDREAEVLRQTLLSAYAAVAGESISNQLDAGIKVIFDYAADRPAGFQLVLGGVADVSEADPIMRKVYLEIIDGVRALVRPHLKRVGVTHPHGDAFIASMLVGMLRSAAAAALAADMDPQAAVAVARSLAESAFRGLDLDSLARL